MFDMMDNSGKKALAGELYSLLADSFTMSFRAQACHWNVRGEDFHQFHEFFAMIYEDVESSIDPTAENIRKLGFDAPLNLSDMCATTMIRDESFTGNPMDMTAALLSANDVIIARIFSAFAAATECNEQAIANYLADRLDKHQKWAWQMKSILNIDGQVAPGKFEADLLLTAPVMQSVEDQLFSMTRPVRFSERTELALLHRVDAHNKTARPGKRTTLATIKAVYRRGATSFSTMSSSHMSRDQWAMARVDAHLQTLRTGKATSSARSLDRDLLPSGHPLADASSVTASANAKSSLSVTLKSPDEYNNVEEAVIALAEFSGQGYEIIPALRATWKRAVNDGEKAYDRAYELATRLYDSRDSDLLPNVD
jgi:starvation-inducible DNA-binding protein